MGISKSTMDLSGFTRVVQPRILPQNFAITYPKFVMVLLGTAMEMLPTAVAKSSSANAATTEMLELSRDFSDYSSFNSDISRELERLAAAAATPGSDAPDLAAVDLNNLGPMDWLANAALLERVEPFVLECMQALGPTRRPARGGGQDKAAGQAPLGHLQACQRARGDPRASPTATEH
ncbi:U-box domain-containing protein 4 [Hordeum vulgare]|nr:U-box domain-containing protein 4 [Hordeum vulgare]